MKTLTPATGIDTATFQVPVDGVDAETAASIEPAFQKSLNAVYTLKNGVFRKIYTADVRLASASWNVPAGVISGQYICTQTTAAAAQEFNWLPIDLPVGGVITAYGMRVFPTAGHVALPAGMPQVLLYQLDQDLGSLVVVGTTAATDSSANVSAYQLAHSVEKTGLSHSVIADRQYWLGCSGEYSTNRINGLYITAAWVTVAAP